MFTYSKIYYFRYTPIDLNKIHIYDQYPLAIPLEIRGNISLCLNLHWIPGALRNKMIQVICEMRNKSINENMFRLWYRNIKYNPPLHFALGAIRKYYNSHCTNIKEVPDEWETLTITSALYRARYLQRSNYTPQRHIVQKGVRQYPNGVNPQYTRQ